MSFIQTFPSGKGGGGGGGDIQVDSFPAASAAELGNIYQYIGNTTLIYVKGCFYECVYEDGSYKWKAISTDSDDSLYEDEDIDFNNF